MRVSDVSPRTVEVTRAGVRRDGSHLLTSARATPVTSAGSYGRIVVAGRLSSWMFPEFQPVGVDLDSAASVHTYDRDQGTDPEADDQLLDRLRVTAGTVLVDVGTGTGSLPVQAARRGATAHAVDVSSTMLTFARQRAESAGVKVAVHHAGLLSYEYPAPVDVITSGRRCISFLTPGNRWRWSGLLMRYGPAGPSTGGMPSGRLRRTTRSPNCWPGSSGWRNPPARGSPAPTSKPTSVRSSPRSRGSSKA